MDERETPKKTKKKTATKKQQRKTEKSKGGMETIAKGWELNDFVVLLS